MANVLTIISIIIPIVMTILFSGLFSAELFVWYHLQKIDSANSTDVLIGNTGPIQAKNSILFITTTKNPNGITKDCDEGELHPELNTLNKIVVKFDRLSTNAFCTISLNGITTSDITEMIITAENRSAHRSDSFSFLHVYFILVVVIMSEPFSVLLAYPFIINKVLPWALSLQHRKNMNNDYIREKIKNEFGIKLPYVDIEILKKIHSGKQTLPQVSHQTKTPIWLARRRLQFLSKYEIIIDNKSLNSDIVAILESVSNGNTTFKKKDQE